MIAPIALTPEQLEAVLDHYDPDILDHLGSNLRERARLRRTPLSVEEARRALESLPLTPSWKASNLADVGRVRIATRILIERGWRPEQIAESMCAVALMLVPHPSIAPEAVAAGIADAAEALS
jgi:hypothetical protein